jgi:hypothetical protein
MNKTVIISPKSTSKSARYLAEVLGADYCNPYKHDKTDFSSYEKVINWGISGGFAANSILNHFVAVGNAVDKIATFKLLEGHCKTLEWTTSLDQASKWIKAGNIVVARELINSSCTKGLDFIHEVKDLTNKPYKLFTKYIDGIGEFRVNVFKGKVVSILEKVQLEDNTYHHKLLYGEPIKQITDMVKAVDTRLGLDYYGLDVIADEKHIYHLIEVNSAPSLFGTTATRFVKLLQKELA